MTDKEIAIKAGEALIKLGEAINQLNPDTMTPFEEMIALALFANFKKDVLAESFADMTEKNFEEDAKSVAEVVRPYIEGAFDAGYYLADKEKQGLPTYNELRDAWLRDNGIIK